MSDPLPTRLHIDPPMSDWQVIPRNGRTKPVIATGHQPYFWHPGILAKDLAADAFAKHVGGSAMHVVVEHNPIGPLTLDMPIYEGNVLHTHRLVFDSSPQAATLPPNRLASLDQRQAIARLNEAAELDTPPSVSDGLKSLARAYSENQVEHAELSEQITITREFIDLPNLPKIAVSQTTSHVVTPSFVDRLLEDPVNCVRCYNRAARAYPEAGIRPLYAGRDVVEAPLWAQGDGVCVPLYVDLGDSGNPMLFCNDPSIELTGPDAAWHLRPRAITLSAIMRSELCDLFIHGTGGGVYDQVTERWWHDWAGEGLAPKAVVSADVYLRFDVPTATPSEFSRAQWFAHHLPHNVDRHVAEQDAIDAALSMEKRELLDRMNDDHDRRRRAKAYKRIHAINAELSQRHDVLIQSARRQAEDARVGVANAEIASRRDWCFALYPEDQLRVLKQQISASLSGD